MKRHACSVTGTRRYRRMEGSCAGAPLAKGPGNIEAAEKAEERETNASEPLAAPEAAGRRETKEPCSMETAKSLGARETNVPEEVCPREEKRRAASQCGQEVAAERGGHR